MCALSRRTAQLECVTCREWTMTCTYLEEAIEPPHMLGHVRRPLTAGHHNRGALVAAYAVDVRRSSYRDVHERRPQVLVEAEDRNWSERRGECIRGARASDDWNVKARSAAERVASGVGERDGLKPVHRGCNCTEVLARHATQ